ncbi:MAG: hypothetical protein WCB90_02900 [Methanosarcina sp.]|jgi:hypothetical protein
MSLADYIPPKFIELFSDPDFSKAIKGYCTYLIKEDKEYREEIKTCFNECLLTSELKPIKRIAELETVTGLTDYSDFEEDHAPTLPEKITELKEKINYFESSRVIVAANMEPEKEEDLLIQNTTLTKKATALKEYLVEKIKPNWSGKTVIENEGIYEFFYKTIEENLRWPEKLKGYRSAKKEIIQRAQELFPDEVEVVRNKSGNKITGLALKPSAKRRDTYAC